MRLRLLVVSLVVLVLSAGTGYAQTFTGMVDGYWNYASNKPKDPNTSQFRAFDVRNESFALNYAELAVDYKPNNFGVRVDVGFGDAADIVNASGSSTWRHIQQAYITAGKEKFTFDFGKFVTPIGAEVIETKDNWNYTRGLLFTNAIPFTHFGGRATYVASDKVTLAAYLVNGWDNVDDENAAKSVGIVATVKPHEKVSVVANFLTGREGNINEYMRKLLDVIVTFNVNDRLSLMANADYGQDKGPNIFVGVSGPRVVWQGIAGYAKLKASEKVILTGRYEWFDDQDGFKLPGTGGLAQEVQSGTFTVQVPVSDLTIWGEVRQDWSNKSPFRKTEPDLFGNNADSFVDHQNTFTVGMTYAFTKEVK
jgi:hypothetical protein